MSTTTKTYNVLIKAEKQTDPVKSVVKEFSDLRSILLLVNLPFRIYHTALRLTHMLQGSLGASVAATTPALTAESGAFDVQTASIELTNTALRDYIVLMAIATEGASLAGAPAASLAAAGIIGEATAVSVTGLQTPEGGAEYITDTGLAMVHAGETIGRPDYLSDLAGERGTARPSGSIGDVNIHISNVTLSPEGDSLTDFTSRMGDQLRMALRSFTRDIPT